MANDRQMPDMWVDPQDDPRDHETELAGERAVLLDYLSNYRLTLQLKCDGLDAEQLARRSVPPSSMSLLGLVRHLAAVEHAWFANVMEGDPSPRPFKRPDDNHADFGDVVPDPAMVEEAWKVWSEEVARAERVVESAESLDIRGTMRDGKTIELREVLVHMIEEYARHCGHADLLRECVDGRTGQ